MTGSTMERRSGETLTAYKKRQAVDRRSKAKIEAVPASETGERSTYVRRNNRIDTLAQLLRSGQITRRQFNAGMTLRDAYETANGAVGNCMDFDSVRSPNGAPSRGPSDRRLIAGHELNRADRLLGALGWPVVEAIACRGQTIEEFTSWQYGNDHKGKAKRRDIDRVGDRLRLSLSLLAGEVVYKKTG